MLIFFKESEERSSLIEPSESVKSPITLPRSSWRLMRTWKSSVVIVAGAATALGSGSAAGMANTVTGSRAAVMYWKNFMIAMELEGAVVEVYGSTAVLTLQYRENLVWGVMHHRDV